MIERVTCNHVHEAHGRPELEVGSYIMFRYSEIEGSVTSDI